LKPCEGIETILKMGYVGVKVALCFGGSSDDRPQDSQRVAQTVPKFTWRITLIQEPTQAAIVGFKRGEACRRFCHIHHRRLTPERVKGSALARV
jgi:hypothetical protein